nr:MAG TPA: BppU domain protein [Caudoviricetes sp.]
METITTAVQSRTPDATRLIQTLYVELDGGGILPPVRLVQYDQRLPVLALRLLHGGKAYALPSGAAANIRVGKNDGHSVYNPAWGVSADRTEVYVEITAQMTVCAGIQMASLEIVADGDIKGTQPLKLDVARNPVQADAYESSDEYKSIYELGQRVIEAGERAKVVQNNLGAIQNIDANMDAIKTAAGSDAAIKTAADNVAAIKTAATDINAIKDAPAQAEAAGKFAQAAAASATAAANSAKAADESAKEAQQVSQGAVGWYATLSALNAAHPTAKDGNWAIVGTTDTIWVWDSDTEMWKDTGEQPDLSNYYPKNEIDKMLAAIRTKVLTVTAPAAGWVSGSYSVAWDDGTSTTYAYRNRVTVEEVTADSRLAVSQRTQPTNAVCQVAALEAGAGVVDFYADSAVSADAVFVVEVTG